MTSATLVIPSRGGAQRLPVLFEALRQQTYRDWDAIVVIDGDIDGSEAVVKEHADALPITSIVFERNLGRVSALNAGFGAATGDVIIRCDDDFEPAPEHVEAHVKAHERRECGVIGLPLNIAASNAYMRAYGQDSDDRSRRAAYSLAESERWRLWGGNTSIPRQLFDRVGGFEASYRGYGWEDLDFGYRLHQLGVPIDIVREAEVRHHMASVTTQIRVGRAYASGTARNHFEHLHGVGSTGAPAGSHTNLWGKATHLASKKLTKNRAMRIAGALDKALPLMPRPLARKSVAFMVESAATAGFLTGYDDHTES